MCVRHEEQLFLILSVFVHQSVCVWPWPNWGDKPKPIDGTGALVLLGFLAESHRNKERDCIHPRPKNDGADCVGETRRTSGCDDGNIPLSMKCGRIQDSLITALWSGLWFFFVSGSCLFMLILNLSFAFNLFLCPILVLFFAYFWFTVWFLVLSFTLTFNNFCYNNESWRVHSCTA